jgi:hypothetical protein
LNYNICLGCENEPNCINNGWIHQECDEDLNILSKDEIEKDDFKFVCRDCRRHINSSKNLNKKLKIEKNSLKK